MPRVQVIICKCGATFSGCAEPYCYTDKDYLKDLRRYVSDGCRVDLVDVKDFNFQKCTCPKKVKNLQPELFASL